MFAATASGHMLPSYVIYRAFDQLFDGDYDQRKLFCEQMHSVFNDNDNITLFTSDEAHFHLNGFVNRQNFRYWGAENPRELHEKPLHSPRVTVWCAVGKNTVIGPYFFEENGRHLTIEKPRTLHELKEAITEEVRRIPRAMLGRVATSFISRLDSCITADGRHMLDVNFRT
ncbi:hypothetical protein M8J76_000717 [Diaphorina citri]|nr:hypothetical protein M8J76_000717 [Diaphorina citri]